MIYDRKIEDVEIAKQLIKEKVQKFYELSESEIETLEKGTITIKTLNRIERKQLELRELLNKIGYWNTNIINKEWENSEIFDITSFKRIIDNTNILRNAFFTFLDSPLTPMPKYYFSNINDIEKILYDLEMMLDDVKSKYRECGTVECGEDNKK